MTRRPRSLFRLAAALLAVGLSACPLIAELWLRADERARARASFDESDVRPDPLLGRRLVPHASGHDADGFRNTAALERADVVALGDSQTWGANTGRAGAWPQLLARISGRTTYNISFGGYGPVQYLALTEKALSLRPKIVVVALYLGDDFYNAYDLVYRNDQHRELRLANPPAELSHDTIAARTQVLQREEKDFQLRYGRDRPSYWGRWLRVHSALGRRLDRAGVLPGKTDLWFEIGSAWARAHPEHGSAYDGGGPRTVFTTALNLARLDLRDPRIAEGLRITKTVLTRIKARTDAAGARLLVLLIPTKEAAYASAVRARRAQADPVYEMLITMEARARAEVAAHCGAAGVKVVDALPRLSEAVGRGEQVYPATTDLHFSADGYPLLAQAVNEALVSSGW
jgi:lysophospholipase L1-like esterase